MSGTSLDGVDIALCEFDGNGVMLKQIESYSFDDDLKQKVSIL